MILQIGLAFQTLVGAAYQFPPGMVVAPGQVIPVMVTGLQTVLPLPGLVRAQRVPLPTTLSGISVTLNQTLPDRSWQLPIFAIQQTNNCAGTNAAAGCLVTAIVVEIPYDITVPNPYVANPVAQSVTTLTVTENSATSQTFQVSPVYDRVHILRSCDIGGSSFGSGSCYPLVAHADGSLVWQDVRGPGGVAQTHTEALPGETLVMYAYGLGAVTTPVTLGAPSPVPAAVVAEGVDLRYDYSPDAGAALPEIGGRPLLNSQPVFVGLTPGQIGLYQINFVVPAPPAGTQPCGLAGSSNLTVSVLGVGSQSFDGVGICVDPGTPTS
jgi:uncharacterized protein (TIGR03437 family)